MDDYGAVVFRIWLLIVADVPWLLLHLMLGSILKLSDKRRRCSTVQNPLEQWVIFHYDLMIITTDQSVEIVTTG